MIRNTKFPCKWTNCQLGFDNPEDLFTHLSDSHVGRKATNNLCLQCQWNNCGTVAAKRDHLASHLRVHLPLKPHQCPLCNKGFKRPQDLKKHERIHTVEHQASLLSNQPGYKPVRRRRKTTTPTIHSSHSSTTSNNSLSLIKDQSELSSELSSSSPSFSFGDSPLQNTTEGDSNGYYNNGYMQDTIQDFIDDILLNQSLPNYDEDMMERLNSIAPVLQQQDTNWTLPCEPGSIPALQNWLEQLSASIQTDENIYPEILTTPHQTIDISAPQQLLDTDDYDLYPKLDDVWTSVPNQQPTSASESSIIHTPPYYDDDDNDKSIKPQFWSPGYIRSPTNIHRPSSYIRKEEYTPSKPINFSSCSSSSSSPATVVFQTAVEQSKPPIPVIDATSTVSFDDKKELMHMMNVFSSSKGKQSYKQPSTKKVVSVDPPTVPIIKREEIKTIIYAKTSIVDTQEKIEHDIKSPYADLVGLIKNMKMEDESAMRKRHALLVDRLWKAVSRST